MRIEGLHNRTGKWIEVADGISSDELDYARDQIEDFAKSGKSRLILWGTTTNTDHFSAFRLSE